LNYAARCSSWSWLSQLDIWFQLVKIWVTTYHSGWTLIVKRGDYGKRPEGAA